MAQASRKDRKLRKVKRERTIAYRLVDLMIGERNQARAFAGAIEQELQRVEKDRQRYIEKYGELPVEPEPTDIVPEGSVTALLSEVNSEQS